MKELQEYPCLVFEQGKNNSFYFAEEMKSTYEYKKMITLSAKLEEKGLTSEQAQMEAFYESIGVKH